MGNSNSPECGPRGPVSGTALITDEEKLDEMFGLLHYLKVAVEDIRAKLAGTYKSNYTVEEVAQLVGRSPYTVRRWIAAGRIEAIRIEGTGPKGRLLVPRDQLDSLVKAGMGAAIPAAVID